MSKAAPQNQAELQDYILLKLGSPVINVEMNQDHFDVAINDALNKFLTFVFDGYEEVQEIITFPKDTSLYTFPDNSVLAVTKVLGDYRVKDISLRGTMDMYHQSVGNHDYEFEHTRMNRTLKLTQTLEEEKNCLVFMYKKIDSVSSSDIWNHVWLKQYAVALAKKQWADNILKYTDVILPSGLALNADGVLAEAKEEIEVALLDMNEVWTFPPLPVRA